MRKQPSAGGFVDKKMKSVHKRSKHRKQLLKEIKEQQRQHLKKPGDNLGIDQDPVAALAKRQSVRRRTTAFLPGLRQQLGFPVAPSMPARSVSDMPRRKRSQRRNTDFVSSASSARMIDPMGKREQTMDYPMRPWENENVS